MGQPNAEVSSGGQRPAAPQQQSADRNNEEDQSWYEGENDYHDERDASAALYTNLVNTLSNLPLDELGHPCQYRDDGTFVSPGEFPAHSVSWWVGGEPEDLMSVMVKAAKNVSLADDKTGPRPSLTIFCSSKMEGGVSAAELDAMTKGPSGWLRLSKWNGEVDGGEIEPDYLQMDVLPGLGHRSVPGMPERAGLVEPNTVKIVSGLNKNGFSTFASALNLLATADAEPASMKTSQLQIAAQQLFPASGRWRNRNRNNKSADNNFPRFPLKNLGITAQKNAFLLDACFKNGRLLFWPVFQGEIGNGYLIDALNCLSARPELVYNVFMQDDRDAAE
eukprot:g14218.t1